MLIKKKLFNNFETKGKALLLVFNCVRVSEVCVMFTHNSKLVMGRCSSERDAVSSGLKFSATVY